jgi:hypothetical protein
MVKNKAKNILRRELSEASWEKEFRKIYPEKKGWIIRQKGFPDRIIFNVRTKELLFFELKAGKHDFHKFQKEMMFILKDAKKRRLFLASYSPTGKKQSIMPVKKNTPAKGWEKVAGFKYVE